MDERTHSALIIGGASGLGRAIAEILDQKGSRVFATGRSGVKLKHGNIFGVDLNIGQSADKLSSDLDSLLEGVSHVDLLVYSAGYLEKGGIGKLNDVDIEIMVNVGLLAPALILQKILRKQKSLPGLIVITSTSQWIPRREEPVYAAVKAGVAMLAHSVSLDPNIGKTLVVGPAGMRTKMQTGSKDGKLLDSGWVAKKIMTLYDRKFKYKLVRILRDPPRVEAVDERLD